MYHKKSRLLLKDLNYLIALRRQTGFQFNYLLKSSLKGKANYHSYANPQKCKYQFIKTRIAKKYQQVNRVQLHIMPPHFNGHVGFSLGSKSMSTPSGSAFVWFPHPYLSRIFSQLNLKLVALRISF